MVKISFMLAVIWKISLIEFFSYTKFLSQILSKNISRNNWALFDLFHLYCFHFCNQSAVGQSLLWAPVEQPSSAGTTTARQENVKFLSLEGAGATRTIMSRRAAVWRHVQVSSTLACHCTEHSCTGEQNGCIPLLKLIPSPLLWRSHATAHTPVDSINSCCTGTVKWSVSLPFLFRSSVSVICLVTEQTEFRHQLSGLQITSSSLCG